MARDEDRPPVVHKVGCAWLAIDGGNVISEAELCTCGAVKRAEDDDERRRIQT
jgi:hypothetical protein